LEAQNLVGYTWPKMASVWLETKGKGILVKGDTMKIKDFLKTKGGKWSPGLKSWLFPGSKKASLMQDLQSCALVQKVEDKTDTGSNVETTEKDGPATAQQKRTQASTGDEEAIDLDDNVRVAVNTYNGKLGVDVRRFYTDKASGELRPGKGLRMSEQEWEAVCKVVERIDSILKEAKETSWSVEGDLTVSIAGGSVDLRRFYTDKSDGEKKPGKQGIRLSAMLWGSLKAEMDNIATKLAAGGNPVKKQKKKKTDPDEAPLRSEKDTAKEEHKKWRKEIEKIVKGTDLQQLSLRKVREQLEESLGLGKDGLLDQKEEVKTIVTEIVQKMP